MTIAELRQKRATIAMQARALLDAASKEGRELTADQQRQFDDAMKDVDNLGAQIEREEKAETTRKKLMEIEADVQRSAGRKTEPTATITRDGKPAKKLSPEERAQRMVTDPTFRRGSKEYRRMFGAWMKAGFRGMASAEFRALQADADIVGGYLIPPVQFVNELIAFVKDLVFIRQFATVRTVTEAASLGVPSLDADPADADWTPEIKTGSEDLTMAFGKRELHPHALAKRIKLSNKLLRLAPDAQSIVLDRLGYKFAITEEKAFLLGTGAAQPLGLFVATANGISTARDVSTSNTTSAITADGLIEAKYKLKAQYQQHPSTCWIFHRDALKMIRKLKDANNQYLWQPMGNGLASDKRDAILDVPFYMSEYVPNTFTTGKYVGIIGAMNYYWIADSLQMSMQRLDELYAETNQTGFILRRELDAMPVLEEAFVRVTLA